MRKREKELIDELIRLRNGIWQIAKVARVEAEKYDQMTVAHAVEQTAKHVLDNEHNGSVSNCVKCNEQTESVRIVRE